jgi:hypothetical protein
VRLIGIAEHYWWKIDGSNASTGLPEITRLPFRRFLLAILSWATPSGVGMKQEEAELELERFNEWMFSPLGLVDPDRVPEEVIEDEMASFKAFASQAGGGK